MTIHIDLKDIKCKKCSVSFIPFRKDFKCPNCHEPTNEFFDFVPELVYSLEYHKQKYGRFTPDAWSTASLADHIQKIIFWIFDNLEFNKPDNTEKFIGDFLERIDWEDQEYLKAHVKEIALASLEAYNKIDEDFREEIRAAISESKKLSKSLRRIFLP